VARVFIPALLGCLLLCLIGVVVMLIGAMVSLVTPVNLDMIETIAAWLMVPITVVSALWLMLWLAATLALPFAYAIERVRRRKRR